MDKVLLEMFTQWIYKAPGKVNETVVIKKVLPALDQEEKKLFYKEVALLNGLNHPNIVKMKGVCQNPLSIMLEYCYFDFKPFGEDVRVTSLSGFLLQINEYKCQGFHDLVNHAAVEIIQGLAYLHSKGIAHRDVKPANVLVNNRHYSVLSDQEEIAQQYESRPIACKLTDFGESRSLFTQTQSVLASKTSNLDRGTVVYLAPEVLVEELCLSGASISDLMLADIWALGMVLFSMLNPSLKCPYLVEIREAGGVKSQEELKTFIRSLLRVGKHPTQDETYQVGVAPCGVL